MYNMEAFISSVSVTTNRHFNIVDETSFCGLYFFLIWPASAKEIPVRWLMTKKKSHLLRWDFH